MSAEIPTHCGAPMVWYSVGAPGVGGGWWCSSCDHTLPIRPTRIQTAAEVR